MPRTRRKVEKHCEACVQNHGGRFRTSVSLYMCDASYKVFLATGEVPGPVFEDDDQDDDEMAVERSAGIKGFNDE